MPHSFPRPEQSEMYVERAAVDGACPACGAEALASYPVLTEGGWWTVVKCQQCLTSLSREPGPLFGSFEPAGLDVSR
jgi:vanillate/4-hydroxybenzoate decarboxylase subunit D